MKGLIYVALLIVLKNHDFTEGTPLQVRSCLHFEITPTSNSNNQVNSDSSDEFESYDEPVDAADDTVISKNTSTVVACQPNASFCYTLWKLDATTNVTEVARQGCWDLVDKKETCINSQCISHQETSAGYFFCCCSEDNCNGNFSYAPNPIMADGAGSGSESEYTPFAPYTSIWSSPTVYICFAMVAIILMLIVGFLTCRETTKAVSELAPLSPSGPGFSSNLYNVDNLKLVSMIGQGKYGTVWKGIVNEQHVAVKIFAAQHRQYFLNEKDIYNIPLLESPALLTYFGCDERRTMDDRIEYLLVLSLAPLGCLQDWLTDNRMPFGVFCRMGKSIANGLAHLHTEIRKGDLVKPCVCHRDLNSRNILVKADLSCCICDLGFALKTFGPRYECHGEIALAETKSINEVGTLRYMAPEVLEGAVNLRDCESALKQIDVYSLGLVLWELATRCDDFYPVETMVPEYKAPYEEEIGTHPNFEQMQVLVSRNKARPRFPPNYENSVAAKVVKDTCEDCWDHDAEARLTALCVQERIQEITTMNPKAQLHKGQTPPLSTNNLIVTTPTAHNKTSPTAVSFMTPPNQQIIPHSNHYCDTTGSASYPKIVNVSVETRNKIIPNGLPKHNINDAYIPDEEDKFKSLTNDHHQQDVAFCNSRGLPKLDNNETQRKIKGLNSVKAMLQKTFHKSHGYVQQDCDDKSNLVENSLTYKANNENLSTADLVNSSSNSASLHINMINGADNDIEKRSVERPNNLDLSSGSGRYEHNIIRSANESSKFKALADDFTSQPFTMIQSCSPNPKLRIVVSKSANAVKNLNSSRSSLSDRSDEAKMKRQRSLEVFHEVFGPKGSIERLRNPSQRVKTPGDVPPSVRKVRASKTLSLYDDRMMDTSRLANPV